MSAIDELPTEAEREAARKLVEILGPLSPEERAKLINRYWARIDGEAKFRELVLPAALLDKMDKKGR